MRRRRTVSTELWALHHVDLDIEPGQSVGIIGENGSGKSTLLKLVAGILHPQGGDVTTEGKVASMLELGAGFHPDFTGRENVYMNGAIHGLSEREVDARFDEIVAFSELAEFIDMPVKTYSSGMHMRLAFAVAIHVDADILLLDEVLAVGDEAFQRKCYGRIFQFRREGGTLLLVSHDASAIESVCDRVIYLADGRIVADGPPAVALARYHEALAATLPTDRDSRSSEQPAGAGAEDGRASYGNGRIRIADVRLTNGAGESTSRFLGGGPFCAELDYEFIDPTTPDPKFTVRVKHPSGESLFDLNTVIDRVPWTPRRPRGTVSLQIPNLPLLQGQFLLSAGISATDESELYHLLDNVIEFSVFAPEAGDGVLVVTRDWKLHGDERVDLRSEVRS